MKKVLLVLLVAVGFSALPKTSIEGLSNTTYTRNDKYIEVVFNGETVLSGNSLSLTLDEILDYSSIKFYGSSFTSGNITTCSIEFKDFRDNSYGAEVITGSIGTTTLKGSKAKFTFANPKPITNVVKMNIIIK